MLIKLLVHGAAIAIIGALLAAGLALGGLGVMILMGVTHNLIPAVAAIGYADSLAIFALAVWVTTLFHVLVDFLRPPWGGAE